MSSYLVDKNTIDQIVTFVSWNTSDFSRSQFRELGINEPSEARFSKGSTLLGAALWRTNFIAVSQRYSDCEPHQLPGPIPFPNVAEYEYAPAPCTAFMAYGNMRRLVYQCSEGDVPDSEAYRSMESIMHTLCRLALESTREWKEFRGC